MSGSFAASLFCLPLFLKKEFISLQYLILVSLLIILLLIMLNPRIIEKTINSFGKKWIRNPVALQFSYLHIILLVILYTIQWMVLGFQLFLLVNAFYQLDISNYLYLASLNALSWLVGFLSIITPSGLGVKEGIFILGFRLAVPVSFAIIVAALIRFYTIIVDLLITAIFFIFDRGAWQNLIDFRKTSTVLKADDND
jgi:hypothetical protein